MSSRSSFKFVAERFGLVRITTLALLAGFGGVFAGAGCNEMGGGALGGECLLDSDCQPNLICAYQFCHIPCRESRDCHKAGEECLISHEKTKNPYNYCAIPPACAQKSECGDFRRCAEDQKCREMCEHDGECLTDQRCFHGSCRNVENEPAAGWDAPAGLYEPCGLHSDCASKLCVDRICRGCGEDYDCGDTRTCDTSALDGAGICRGGIIQLHVSETEVPFDAVVTSAALNSDGSTLYFVTSTRSLFKVSVVNGYASGPSLLICNQVPELPYEPDIVVSSDDTTLYFTGQAAVWQIGTQSEECADILQVPSTLGAAAVRLGIQGQNGIDKLYVFGANARLIVDLKDPENFTFWNLPINAVDFAIGETRSLAMGQSRQIFEIDNSGMILYPVVPDATAGTESFLTSPTMALSYNEDTIYVATASNGLERIIATNLADVYTHRIHTKWAPFSPQFVGGTHLNRARNKDLFTWVTSEGKLYLFEPL